jgi:hypothetical protein
MLRDISRCSRQEGEGTPREYGARMACASDRLRQIAPPLALIGLLAAGLAVRVAVLPVPGHGWDVDIMSGWAENLAAFGPWRFYDHDWSPYPALLPFLWPLGLALDGDQLFGAIKALSIPFDLLTGVFLFVLVARRAGWLHGLLAAGLYLLNPAVIIAGPLWGQVDAAGTLLLLGALVALAGDRFAAAGALAVLAGLVKPQFGLAALPVLTVVTQRWWRERQLAPLGTAILGGIAAWSGLGVLIGLSPWGWAGQVARAASAQPETSLSAFNVWAFLVGSGIPDAPYVTIGAVLLVAGLAAALVPLRRGHDLATVLAVGMMLAFAFYFLPTRVHERYLFPALALAAPFAAVDRRSLAAYLALSTAFALSLFRVLIPITPSSLPADLQALLMSDAMTRVIGLALIGSALTLIWRVLSGAGAQLARPPEVSAAPG